MIFQQKVSVIVKLVICTEDEERTCHVYWPAYHKTKEFSKLKVRHIHSSHPCCSCYHNTTKNEAIPWIVWSQFEILDKDSGEMHNVYLLHVNGWPDFGVPFSSLSIYHAALMTHKLSKQLTTPVVVHCSAGVGRTGTYVAIHLCLAPLFDILFSSRIAIRHPKLSDKLIISPYSSSLPTAPLIVLPNQEIETKSCSSDTSHEASPSRLSSSPASLLDEPSSSSSHLAHLSSEAPLSSPSASVYPTSLDASTSKLESLHIQSIEPQTDSMQLRLLRQATSSLDSIYQLTEEMRRARNPQMIQSFSQYLFAHTAVYEFLEYLGLTRYAPSWLPYSHHYNKYLLEIEEINSIIFPMESLIVPINQLSSDKQSPHTAASSVLSDGTEESQSFFPSSFLLTNCPDAFTIK
ncbi:putative tyrosine specific protein phosphatase [Monocercomonoides exilis]|uniref:putative tyrosine specific protein phosphatase n=1 Tax=Monocercomonoides exilis TaxID=2049356 RepID=UPI003559907E|nr:putative tyrosine specific protein phosphatase [Monocercomonoides exilis]